MKNSVDQPFLPPFLPHSTERGAVVNKTQEYLEIFSRFKNRESVEAVDRLLNSQPDLDPFEKAQLGSLCCDSAEEAKTLIPSLGAKKGDEELQDLLNEVSEVARWIFWGPVSGQCANWFFGGPDRSRS